MHEREPDDGMEAFSRLLQERTGYPKRGALAELERISGIYGPMIGRWIRQEVRPTDANLRRLAPALGLTFDDLWRILNPSTYSQPAPDPDTVYRLSSLLDEMQALVVSLRTSQVASAVQPINPPRNGRRGPLHKRPDAARSRHSSGDDRTDTDLNPGLTAPSHKESVVRFSLRWPIWRQLLAS